MHHLLEHINQDIKKIYSKEKDSTVNTAEYQSKRNQTGKPRSLAVEVVIGLELAIDPPYIM